MPFDLAHRRWHFPAHDSAGSSTVRARTGVRQRRARRRLALARRRGHPAVAAGSYGRCSRQAGRRPGADEREWCLPRADPAGESSCERSQPGATRWRRGPFSPPAKSLAIANGWIWTVCNGTGCGRWTWTSSSLMAPPSGTPMCTCTKISIRVGASLAARERAFQRTRRHRAPGRGHREHRGRAGLPRRDGRGATEGQVAHACGKAALRCATREHSEHEAERFAPGPATG
jgi:hypothetical protein